MRIPTITAILAAALLSSASAQNGTFSVFLDDGSTAPGSTNSGSPFATGDRNPTWDILATTQTGLSGFGAAVVQVSLITFNTNGDSRGANTAGGNGLGVNTGTPQPQANSWIDGNEAAMFQFSFFSDLAKTQELTGLTITLDSVLVRHEENMARNINAFTGSGTLTDNGEAANDLRYFLNDTQLSVGNDSDNSDTSQINLTPAELGDGGAPVFYTIASSGVSMGEDDYMWFRRPGGGVYQLAGVTLSVIPEPGSFAAIFGVMALGVVALRRRAR